MPEPSPPTTAPDLEGTVVEWRDELITLPDIAEKKRTNDFLSHSDYTVPEAMSLIAGQVADKVAIDSGDERITYGELHARASQIARALLDRGLDPAVPVFILCDHGVAPPTAICGVLYAGLIGAPVDVREPADRLARMFEQAAAEWVVTDRPFEHLARGLSDKVLLLDEASSYETTPPDVDVPEEQPGLILFTSGSTGVPKGVYNWHRAIVPKSMRGVRADRRPEENSAVTSSWGFTAAEGQLFSSLINGRTICTYDLRNRGARDLPEWVQKNEIRALVLMPSVLRALLPTTAPGAMSNVRRVTLGAEPLYWSDVLAARPLFGTDTVLIHAIGSTEVGGIASYEIPKDAEPDDEPIPVGSWVPSVEVRVVDEDDREVPQGEPGRIVLLRRGHLARGYWRDPELTAEHFFVDEAGRQGFRTSDQGRIRPDGLLEHLGRLDTRVKVRGAMVATSEVEVALLALDDVADAAVIAATDDGGATRLVAYVVAEPGRPLSAWKLRRDVARRLPTTMVPAAFVAMAELPRTVRSKVDRAALPPPPPHVVAKPYRAPVGNDADLAAIFADVLGVERVGLDDDFFDLGGDSLGVVELLAGIADRFSVDLPASAVLEAPTVAQLALRLSHRRSRAASPVVPLRTDCTGTPFFCVTGGGAPAVSLRALSEAMPGQNLYAIQARGLEERALPDHSIEAAAGRNLIAVREVQPAGPYLLGGYSYGGLVAFEMACRLHTLGEDVAMLVLLDIGAPTRNVTVANRVKARTTSLRADAPLGRVQHATTVAARTARFAGRSALAHAERRLALSGAGLFPRRGYHQYELFLRLHTRMAAEYHPTSTFDGPVLLVRSGRDDLGWSRLVTGPLSVVDVPADHLGLVRTPVVERVGQIVADVLSTRAAGVGS